MILSGLVTVALAAGGIAACGSKSHRPTRHQVHLAALWGMPSTGRPRALLLLIHGGSWTGQNPQQLSNEVANGRTLQRLGYETLAFDYRRGAQGIQDADAFYQLARKRVGPNLPICALGWSAGGQIALMLAVKNPDLACVIDFAGPTNLVALSHEPGGMPGYQLAVHAFGARQLATYSPALHAGSIRAKVLLILARNDPILPVPQGQDMTRALSGARLILLPPGPVPFVHSGVGESAYNTALKAAEAFLARAASSRDSG